MWVLLYTFFYIENALISLTNTLSGVSTDFWVQKQRIAAVKLKWVQEARLQTILVGDAQPFWISWLGAQRRARAVNPYRRRAAEITYTLATTICLFSSAVWSSKFHCWALANPARFLTIHFVDIFSSLSRFDMLYV